MTNSLSRLLALPFALILIFVFTSGGLDFTGPKTIAILVALVCLALIYVFNREINIWWWKRKLPQLDKPLKSWIRAYSKYYGTLSSETKDVFERRIAAFINIKNFTLKVERNYKLEEDVKAIIAHEFMRVTLNFDDFLYDDLDQFVIYNHAFGSPDIQTLHSIELYRPDKVIILSKEQLINGFVQPDTYVNIALLAAVMSFIMIHPRLAYPDVNSLNPEDISDAHGIRLEVVKSALGIDWINRLDLLIFCYLLYPYRTESFDPDRYEKLERIFNPGAVNIS